LNILRIYFVIIQILNNFLTKFIFSNSTYHCYIVAE
jgi:hypothetical protein